MLGIINIIKYKKLPLVFIILSSILYLIFAYDLARTDTLKLPLLYVGLFVFAYLVIKSSGFYFRILVIASVLFRLLFLFAIPNLSQDFYRFIWDGQMILSGLNPYLSTPDYQMELGALTNFPNQLELYHGMGSLSASNYTNYPPLNQLCFVIANLFPGHSILNSIVGMRILIIGADLGTLYFGKKLLEKLNIPSGRIFWYILNPFIIIELTGNLHFEGVMVFFFVWSLYLLHCRKWLISAIILACSISIKLIPIMFLPLFFKWFKKENGKVNFKKLIKFYSVVGVTLILFFIPFFSMEFITNYSKTIGLWFGNFEFNGSIYYLAREIGYAITGYNEIAIITKIFPLISLSIILYFSFFRATHTITELATSMLLTLSCYLFLSTTVHPWYLTTLIILSIYAAYRYALIWSVVIILSYFAYADIDYAENLWVLAFEYLIVFSVFIWEVVLKKKINI
ncbi:mannosyltransferase [Winogradskyella sp.]|uniref:mannosyltransferase n=1 Tax=Winogradskyella sp. TaxID=1883156 RepID=UPI003F69F426